MIYNDPYYLGIKGGKRGPERLAQFDPSINRHTGKPHENKREIARRARQAER